MKKLILVINAKKSMSRTQFNIDIIFMGKVEEVFREIFSN